MTTKSKSWMTVEEMKAVDWNDAALCVNKSTRSGDLIIARKCHEGCFAVIAVRDSLVCMLQVVADKWHAVSYARKCAAQGWA